MPQVTVFVDFDNVEPGLSSAGPVTLAKLFVPLLPGPVIGRNSDVLVRLYGGWRCQGTLTTGAQRLVPDIRSGSPTVVAASQTGTTKHLRLTVELADRPIGSTAQLEETLVRDRGLRRFRAKKGGWAECADPSSCGLQQFSLLSHSTPCSKSGCTSRLGHVFVRDEQKMVDTLMVADIAYQALRQKVSDVVVVSSDADIWPGVLLALQAGCTVTHVHPRPGWKTQRYLLNSLGVQMGKFYQQLSV